MNPPPQSTVAGAVVPATTSRIDGVETGKTRETVAATNAEFVAAIFHALPEGAYTVVASLADDPDKAKGWPVYKWPCSLPEGNNNYFALGSYYPGDDGEVRRRKTCFAALHAIMLDDLGSKANMERLGDFPLSWLIETSPGNYQGGIILAEPIAEAAAATRLMNAIIDAGLCDSGANGPLTRNARLPGGINGKAKYGGSFQCRLTEWRPDARYTPEEIVLRLELDMMPAGRPKRERDTKTAAPGTDAHNDEVHVPRPSENPVIAALKARGLYKTALGGGRHDITCPWLAEHTSGDDDGTAYFEPDDGFPLGGFKCLHSHGERLHVRELLEFLAVPVSAARMQPTIRVVAGEIHRVVERAEAELAARARHYQAGGLIVTVTTHPETKDPLIQPVSVSALTGELARTATWESFDKRAKSWVRCDPPARHIACLYDAQSYQHLKPLAGLARQPYYRADGSLVLDSGYDGQARLFGVFDASEFPVKASPCRADAEAALEQLASLLTEFRFAGNHDRAAALAAILTAVVRPSLPNAPMFHVRAPVMGSGKSYLCKLITAFAGPGPSAPCSYPADGAEATKVLLALLMRSPAVVEFDDMSTDLLPHSAMNRVLTEERISDRILGESKTVAVSTRALFLSSGNNVGPVRDMLRRVVTIQIDPRCQTPATIQYEHGPVEEVRCHRGRYVAAALTIIQAWRQAGMLRADVPAIATYGGAWADYCRHPLIWLGLPDPATALLDQLTHDPDADTLGRILSLWHAKFDKRPMQIREVLTRLPHDDELLDAFREIAEERGEVNRGRLGWWIKRHENRIVEGLEFRRADSGAGRVAWYVSRTATVSPVSSGTAVPVWKTVTAPVTP